MITNIYKHSIKGCRNNTLLSEGMFFGIVDKYEEMIGSYSPKTDIQMHDCTSEQAPAGFFARGTYKGKAIVINFLFFFK